MRRFNDLEKEELALLTEDQINHFVEIELAHEGLEPVAEPQVPTIEDVGIVKNITLYRVGSHYGLLFLKEEDAKTVALMPQMEEKYSFEIGSEWKWAIPNPSVTISEELFYDQADVMRVSKALHENKAKQEPYDEARRNWDKYLKESGEYRASVWEAVANAKEHYADVRLAIKSYQKFKRLAEGDTYVADKFFRDAYSKKGDTFINEVLSHPDLNKEVEEKEEDKE